MARNRRKSQSNKEQNNFQDKTEIREYDKGFRAGSEGRQKRLMSKDHKTKDEAASSYSIELNTANDPEWSIPSTQVNDAVARISMHFANGARLNKKWQDSKPFNSSSVNPQPPIVRLGTYNIPGVMTLYVAPTFGETQYSEDPFNRGISMEYNYIQRNTGRVPSYEPADLGLYNIAVTSIHAFYAEMTRLYGLLNDWNMENQYVPEAIVTALGYDYSNLKSQMANFRYYINQFALALGTMPLPDNMGFIKKHIFQFQRVFADATTQKAQYYVFAPAYFYRFIEGDPNHPTSYCSTMQYNEKAYGSKKTLQDIIIIGDGLLNNVIGSEDLALIKADLLNSFSSFLQVSMISDSYVVTAENDDMVREQIENAYIYGLKLDAINVKVEQNTDINSLGIKTSYKWYPTNLDVINDSTTPSEMQSSWTGLDAYQQDQMLFNTHIEGEVDPSRVNHALRYAGTGLKGFVPHVGSSGTPYNASLSYYTNMKAQVVDPIISAQITYFSWSNYGIRELQSVSFSSLTIMRNEDNDVANLLSLLSRFDWHPSVQIMVPQIGSPIYGVSSMIISDCVQDLENYAIVPESQLENINKVAQLGYYTPQGL